MTLSTFYADFELLNDLNPDYTWAAPPQEGPFWDVVTPFVGEFRPSVEIFTPSLVTFGDLGYYGRARDQYLGDFQQADDGTISGTITGIVTNTAELTVQLFQSSSDWSSGDRGVTEIPEIRLLGERKTSFEVFGLQLDFETFFEALTAAPEDISLPSVQGLLFSGNDEMRGIVRDSQETPFDVRGYEGNDLIVSRNSNDEVEDNFFGDEGDDTLNGYAGDDNLDGGDDNDSLDGGDGDDLLKGGDGNDQLDGGEGLDRAIFEGPQNSYTLTLAARDATLTDRRDDGTGTDSLEALEFLDFGGTVSDDAFQLFKQDGISELKAWQLESFIELYIAYFNRAPDAAGLGFWGTVFADGGTLEETAKLFISSTEYQTTYPETQSNAAFAEAVYNNVLGRTPDQSGFDFWVGVLDREELAHDQFILQVLRGAKTAPDAAATQAFIDQQLADRDYLANKVDIGAYFSVHKGMSDVDNASAAMALYDGSAASIAAAVSAIDGFYTDALDPGSGAFLIQVVGVLDDPFGMV